MIWSQRTQCDGFKSIQFNSNTEYTTLHYTALTALQQLIHLNRSSREHNQRLAILKNIRSGFEIHGNEGTHNALQFVDLGFTDTLDLTQFARCSVRQTLHCVISRVREFLDVVCGYAVVDKYFERLIAYFLRVCTLC